MANSDNPAAGAAFEVVVREYFQQKHDLVLERGFSIEVGAASVRRPRRFDLGSEEPPVLIECKRHTWTEGGNAPSAKLTCWNEAMHYFAAAPTKYRRILVVSRSMRNGQSLAQHYLTRFTHLVPAGVELWELDPVSRSGGRLFTGS